MATYILSIDAGTTSSRAIIFDKNLKKIGIGQKEFAQYFPKNSWVEHDPNEIWSSQFTAIKAAIKTAKLNPEEITSIGITNQRETTIIWDRFTGEPIYNAIVWQDRRTSDYCDSFDSVKMGMVAQKTGLIVDAYFSASKIRWILNNVDGARDRAQKGELCFGTVDTWLIYKLTAGESHITDATNASRTMLFDIESGTWDEELCELFEIPMTLLPQVVDCSGLLAKTNKEIIGHAIPISGIAGDQQSALFGQRCFYEGEAKNTYGTGCFAMLNTGEKIVRSKTKMLSTIAWSLDGKRTYALEGSVYVAGSLVQWLRDGLGIIDKSDDVESLALEEGRNGGVTIIPALTGLGAPHWDSYARGAIMGLTRATNISHIAYAALEAIALSTADVLQAMSKDMNQQIQCIKVDGGASNNNTLMQIQSNILSCPVIRPSETESTALGAALLSGLGIGVWQNLEILKSMTELEETFTPVEIDLNDTINQWEKGILACQNWIDTNE